MTKVRVPAEYEGGHPQTPGGRSLKIRRDDDGRYIGAPEQCVPALEAFLDGDDDAVTRDGTLRVDAYSDDASDDDGDAPAPLDADASDLIERGECPWCSDYSGDGVPQHASSAHPDEWADYKDE